jgi:hypothetical protein
MVAASISETSATMSTSIPCKVPRAQSTPFILFQHYTAPNGRTDELEWIWKEAVVAQSKYYPRIRLEGLERVCELISYFLMVIYLASMEALCSSETSVTLYQTTRRHILKDLMRLT